MSKRTPYVGGNWKMNLHRADATALAAAVAQHIRKDPAVEVAVFPAFPYLYEVAGKLAGSAVKLGAQDFYHEKNGAYTGEVSLSMLQDVGCKVVLIGHSERRHVIGESDALLNEKTHAAIDAGLGVIFCVGEQLEQRDAGKTMSINAGQVCLGLAGVQPEKMAAVTIAYEPVWAIGTGKTATPQDAQEAHAGIRKVLGSMFGEQVAQATRIQYGGSVKPSNASELFSQPDIDGGLIGGASLKADDFCAIVDAAK